MYKEKCKGEKCPDCGKESTIYLFNYPKLGMFEEKEMRVWNCNCSNERYDKAKNEENYPRILKDSCIPDAFIGKKVDYSKLVDVSEKDIHGNDCIMKYSEVVKYIDDLWENVRVGRSLFLFGTPGTGKTTIGMTIANMCMEHGKSVKYVKSSSIVSEKMTMHSLVIPDVLIIDDWGMDKIELRDNIIFTLLDTRINSRKTVILITNQSEEDAHHFWPEPMLDRIKYFKKACFAGPSFRNVLDFEEFVNKKITPKIESNLFEDKMSDLVKAKERKELFLKADTLVRSGTELARDGFIKTGIGLKVIWDEELWMEADASSWGAYCAERGFNGNYAMRLIDIAEEFGKYEKELKGISIEKLEIIKEANNIQKWIPIARDQAPSDLRKTFKEKELGIAPKDDEVEKHISKQIHNCPFMMDGTCAKGISLKVTKEDLI